LKEEELFQFIHRTNVDNLPKELFKFIYRTNVDNLPTCHLFSVTSFISIWF